MPGTEVGAGNAAEDTGSDPRLPAVHRRSPVRPEGTRAFGHRSLGGQTLERLPPPREVLKCNNQPSSAQRRPVCRLLLPRYAAPLPGYCFTFYGSTVNGTLLNTLPLGLTTSTLPVVVPAGTVAVIRDFETTVNVASVPLNVTLVAPVKLVPRMFTAVPAVPEVGTVST